MKNARTDVDLERLDLAYLALFVGQCVNDRVLDQLHRKGFGELRQAHGYVFQHLLGGPRRVTELASLLGVSQQAASKSVRELAAAGYVEDAPSTDGRAREVALSARGRAAVAAARAARAKWQRRFEGAHGAEVARARSLLRRILGDLGGLEAVRARRVRPPR